MTLALSEASRTIAGTLLLTLVAVEFGGAFLLRVARRRHPATPLQRDFFRAGHAHAGVLVIFGLVVQPLVDASGLGGLPEMMAREGPLLAAILLPAGFFLSVTGRGVTRRNRLVVLIWLGVASLAAGVVTLGIGLLAA